MKAQWIRLWVLVAAAVLLAGCAGRDFVRPGDGELRLGIAKYKEVTDRFGTPYQEGTQTMNGRFVKVMSYAYATVGGAPVVEGITPARAVGFYFENDVLVGKEFLSSFKDDATLFDEAIATKVKKGQSRSDVIRIAGRPHAEYLPPVAAVGAKDSYAYMYQHSRGFSLYHRKLVVSFGRDDRVTDVVYSTNGKF